VAAIVTVKPPLFPDEGIGSVKALLRRIASSSVSSRAEPPAILTVV
jgi:hypothetical protein